MRVIKWARDTMGWILLFVEWQQGVRRVTSHLPESTRFSKPASRNHSSSASPSVETENS